MATTAVSKPGAIPFPAHWHILAMSPLRDLVGLFTSYLNVKDTIAFLSSCGTLWDIRSPRFFKQLDFVHTEPTLGKFTDFVTSCVGAIAINLNNFEVDVSDDWGKEIGTHCPNLTKLAFSVLSIKAFDEPLASCKNLQELIMAGYASYPRNESLLRLIPNLRKLKRFSAWSVNDAVLKLLAEQTQCTTIQLFSPLISDNGIDHLKDLHRFQIHGAKEITSAGLVKLILRCPKLQELDLERSRFDDQCLQALMQCRDLQVLKITIFDEESITLERIVGCCKKTKIKDLHLDISAFTQEWFDVITANCPSLECLTFPKLDRDRTLEHLVTRQLTVVQFNKYQTVRDGTPQERAETLAWQMGLKATRMGAFARTDLLHPDTSAPVSSKPSRKRIRVKKKGV